MSYGPYGAVAGALAGGWAKDFDKGITGDSRSGLVEGLYGAKSGGIGTKVTGNFSSDDRDKMYVDEKGDFSWGSTLGNVGNLAGSYFGGKYGGSVGGKTGGQTGGNVLGNIGSILDRKEGPQNPYQESLGSSQPRTSPAGYTLPARITIGDGTNIDGIISKTMRGLKSYQISR